MLTPDFVVTAGAVGTQMDMVCQNPDGTPRDLTGARVYLLIGKQGAELFRKEITIVDAAGGACSYLFVSDDFNTLLPGTYDLQVSAVWVNLTQYFPVTPYACLEVIAPV